MDAKVADNLKGFVELETTRSTTLNTGVAEWGNFNKTQGTLDINQAWILYTGSGLLGTPSGIKVGHMPLALGEKLFFDHSRHGDDAIVVFIDPNKNLHIGALTIKAAEAKKDLTKIKTAVIN
jgi:hypothetical protein